MYLVPLEKNDVLGLIILDNKIIGLFIIQYIVGYLHKLVNFLPAVISHLESHFILFFALHPQNPYTPTLSICRKGGEKSCTVNVLLLCLFPHGSSVVHLCLLTV
jgi:hypothetical protein